MMVWVVDNSYVIIRGEEVAGGDDSPHQAKSTKRGRALMHISAKPGPPRLS